jgi:hypothetical protein
MARRAAGAGWSVGVGAQLTGQATVPASPRGAGAGDGAGSEARRGLRPRRAAAEAEAGSPPRPIPRPRGLRRAVSSGAAVRCLVRGETGRVPGGLLALGCRARARLRRELPPRTRSGPESITPCTHGRACRAAGRGLAAPAAAPAARVRGARALAVSAPVHRRLRGLGCSPRGPRQLPPRIPGQSVSCLLAVYAWAVVRSVGYGPLGWNQRRSRCFVDCRDFFRLSLRPPPPIPGPCAAPPTAISPPAGPRPRPPPRPPFRSAGLPGRGQRRQWRRRRRRRSGGACSPGGACPVILCRCGRALRLRAAAPSELASCVGPPACSWIAAAPPPRPARAPACWPGGR